MKLVLVLHVTGFHIIHGSGQGLSGLFYYVNSDIQNLHQDVIVFDVRCELRNQLSTPSDILFVFFSDGSVVAKTQIMYLKATKKSRVKKCQEFTSLKDSLKRSQALEIISLNVMTLGKFNLYSTRNYHCIFSRDRKIC